MSDNKNNRGMNGKGYYIQILSITKGSDDGSIPIGSF